MEPRLSLIWMCLCLLVQSCHGGGETVKKMVTGESSPAFDPSRVTQISRRPRAFLCRGFLSHEECDHLIDLAEAGKLEKSMVADLETGESLKSEIRTSSDMFLSLAQDEIVASIEGRIAVLTFLPVENGEGMEILHYEKGQKYEPHHDYFLDELNLRYGGQRMATVLMYLSDVAKGGETVFPDAEEKHRHPKGDNWSKCAKQGLAVKPRKGDALLFFNIHLNATIDPASLHGSCPVIEGEKWSATKWIHVRTFGEPLESSERSDCVDENPSCSLWALQGECAKNSSYMVGSEGSLGHCRKSCKVC